MIDLVIVVVVLVALALIAYLLVVVGPARRETKAAVQIASRTIDANANHEEMFLLLHELLVLDDGHHLFEVFPNDETKDRARALVNDYRRQHVAVPPKGLPS